MKEGNSWRPPSWDTLEIAKRVFGENTTAICRDYELLIEAGADAILEALKSKGAFMNPEQMKLIAPDRKYPYGWLVFIPEEKK